VERRNPGFRLAGTYRDGISLGEAIASGERAAARVSDLLGTETAAAGSQRPAGTASAAGQD
jgi:hypothetical protein